MLVNLRDMQVSVLFKNIINVNPPEGESMNSVAFKKFDYLDSCTALELKELQEQANKACMLNELKLNY